MPTHNLLLPSSTFFSTALSTQPHPCCRTILGLIPSSECKHCCPPGLPTSAGAQRRRPPWLPKAACPRVCTPGRCQDSAALLREGHAAGSEMQLSWMRACRAVSRCCAHTRARSGRGAACCARLGSGGVWRTATQLRTDLPDLVDRLRGERRAQKTGGNVGTRRREPRRAPKIWTRI